MANSYEYELSLGKCHRHIRGSFCPNGAAVDTSTTNATRGVGFTPSHSGTTGIYRVTLEDPFVNVVAVLATYQQANADTTPTRVVPGEVDITNKTIDFVVWAESGGTQAKANVTASGILRRINFDIVVAVDNIPGSGVV